MSKHRRIRGGTRSLPLTALGLTLAVVVAACGPMEIRVPRVAQPSTGKFQYGKFVWFDLATSDVDSAKRFYGELFGWVFSDLAEGDVRYTVVENRNRMIAGIVSDPEAKGDASLWIGSISVPDVDRAAEQTREAGGVVHDPPQ